MQQLYIVVTYFGKFIIYFICSSTILLIFYFILFLSLYCISSYILDENNKMKTKCPVCRQNIVKINNTKEFTISVPILDSIVSIILHHGSYNNKDGNNDLNCWKERLIEYSKGYKTMGLKLFQQSSNKEEKEEEYSDDNSSCDDNNDCDYRTLVHNNEELCEKCDQYGHNSEQCDVISSEEDCSEDNHMS